jgi:hypothetical protein
MINSRRMRWAWHAVRTGEKRNAYRILVGRPEGKRPLERAKLCVWIILKWILERYNWMVWIGLIWLRIGTNLETET